MKGVIAILAAAYPLLVYFGLARFSIGAVAAVLAVLALLRLIAVRPQDRRRLVPATVAMAAFAGAVMVTGSHVLLQLYPVLVNLVLLGWFGYTLVCPPCAIQRFSDLMGMTYPPQAIPYMIGLTKFWCAFFLLNAGIAAYTVSLADMKIWALYNGLIVYFVIGAIFIVEYLVRRIYRRRIGDT